MGELMVVGNCYSDDKEYSSKIFKTLTDAGYTLAYNSPNKTSVTIMVEMTEEEQTEE